MNDNFFKKWFHARLKTVSAISDQGVIRVIRLGVVHHDTPFMLTSHVNGILATRKAYNEWLIKNSNQISRKTSSLNCNTTSRSNFPLFGISNMEISHLDISSGLDDRTSA